MPPCPPVLQSMEAWLSATEAEWDAAASAIAARHPKLSVVDHDPSLAPARGIARL